MKGTEEYEAWLDKVTDKSCADNYPEWDDDQLKLTYVNGMNLWSMIRKAKDDGITMGGPWYTEKRKMLAAATNADKAMPLGPPNEPDDPRMTEAFKKAFSGTRDFASLEDWCETKDEINHKVCRGLFKGLSKIPLNCFENSTAAIAALKLVHRLGLQGKFPELVEPMKPHFDRALLKTLSHYRNNEQSNRNWWAHFGDAAQMLIPRGAMEDILKCDEKDWSPVAGQIHEVHNSGKCGQKMVSREYAAIQKQELTRKVCDEVSTLMGKPITEGMVVESRKRFTTLCEGASVNPDDTFPSEEWTVHYRREEIDVVCNTWLDKYTSARQAVIQGTAVDNNQLTALWCEDDLVSPAAERSQSG